MSSYHMPTRGEVASIRVGDMAPLTDDEAALFYHAGRWGSAGYPVRRLGSRWIVDSWRSVQGPPTVFRTKREAVARFELWLDLALERWREMLTARPNLMLTATGIQERAS